MFVFFPWPTLAWRLWSLDEWLCGTSTPFSITSTPKPYTLQENLPVHPNINLIPGYDSSVAHSFTLEF
jgi:hypothetical protein